MDETGFTGLKQERGWSYENSWLPIPDGWWGADIWLDQWAIFGYEDFEEWKFGVKIRSNQDGTIQSDDRWCINDGVEFFDGWGDETYEYMYKVPDQSTDYDFEVGYCYTPVLYDATVDGGEYIDGETPSFDGLSFCIGEPYMPLDDMEITSTLINAFFVFADDNEDGCATRDEMTALYEEAINLVEGGDTLAYLDTIFMGGD